MIDVKELSIGDWLRCNDINIQVAAIGKTVGFFDCNNHIYWAYEGLDRIDTIPLTEDILVKNGFEKSERWHNCTMRTSDDFRICVQFKCGGSVDYITIMKHFNDLINRDVDVALSIHHVHQLQHLLRLCGIEKEIEL